MVWPKRVLRFNKLRDFHESVHLCAYSHPDIFGFVKAVDSLFPNGRSTTKQLFKDTDGKWNRDYLGYNVLGIIFDIIDDVGHKSILLTKSKKNMHNQLRELYGQTQIAFTISKRLINERAYRGDLPQVVGCRKRIFCGSKKS